MQNQAAVEALYSATMVEDYLDVVENLPNELQRHISVLRELDMNVQKEFLWELDTLLEELDKEKTVTGQRHTLSKIRMGLIAAQDIGDDKLKVAQAIADTIENKSRMLENDAKNLDFANDDEDEDDEEATVEVKKTTATARSAASAAGNGGGGESKGGGDKGGSGGGAKGSGGAKSTKRLSDTGADKAKRRKKQQNDKSGGRDDDDDDVGGGGNTNMPGTSKSSSRSRSQGGGQSGQSAAGGSSRRPTAKRKQTRNKNSGNDKNKDDDNSDKDVDLSNIEIDPDEPTYCLCDQVSYGDMIGCDNDLCPIEWFHFNCVSLSHKPKGKWFCPRCRGDKPTVMKPKAQFLKELEKYNKEREEKMMRQSNG